MTPARALTAHRLKSTFGIEGSGLGQFKEPTGVAVNAPKGWVYVVDTGNNRVQRFSTTGEFLGWFDGSGTFEIEGTVEHGSVAPAKMFLGPDLVAVDNSGSVADPSHEDVYVLDRKHGVIDKFNAVGEYVGVIGGAGMCAKFDPGEAERCSVTGLAVDPVGDVWISVDGGPIYKFSNAVDNQQLAECETEFGGVSKLAVDGKDDLYFEVGNGVFAEVDEHCKILFNPFSGDKEAHSAAVDPMHGAIYLDNRDLIESFDLEGGAIESRESGAPAGAFGSGVLGVSKALAVDVSTSYVFASDSEHDDVAIFEAVTLPGVEVLPVSGQSPRGVTLNGTVNPGGNTVTRCVFEYDSGHAYKQGEAPHGIQAPCVPGTVGSGTSPVPVTANLSGLVPQTRYYYRLVAENSFGVSTSAGHEFFTGPLVEGEWSTSVSSNSATIQTRIDPNGDNTSVYVEYGPTAALGSFAPLPPPGLGLGSTIGPQTVNVHLQGLDSSTIYYYRVIVVQAGETFGCDSVNETAGECDTMLRSLNAPTASANMLDGRSWELVSPADKKGALIEAQTELGGDIQAASDGNGVTYIARGPHLGETTAGHLPLSQVLSRRIGAGSWSSTDLTLASRLPEGEVSAQEMFESSAFEYRLFSPGLSVAAVEPPSAVATPPLTNETSERTLYLRDNETGHFLALVSPANTTSPIEPTTEEHEVWELHFLTATPDLSHVVFKTPMALTSEAVDEESPTIACKVAAEKKISEPHCYEEGGNVQWNVYEWSDGELSLVNVLPNGQPAQGRLGSGIPGVRLAGIENSIGRGHGGSQRAMSADGRRVAWVWGEPYTPPGLTEYLGLYVRDMSEARTVRVGGASAVYQTMSSDGSKIFYLEDGDLYEYNWELGAPVGTSIKLTEPGAGVEETVSDVNEEGTYVYFIATGVLAPGSTKGENNLYGLHETEGKWTTTFIATLAAEDRPSWYAVVDGTAPFLANISSRVSPDGRYLAFMSSRPLTGYDNVDTFSGQHDEEVYLYDAEHEHLVCASCNPTGARPIGVLDTPTTQLLVDRQGTWTSQASVGRNPRTDHWLAGSIPAWDNLNNSAAVYQPRYLSNSGRLFFDSPDGLVPQDTNGLEDVYTFEPEGIGDCASTTATGTQVYVSEVASHPVGGCVGLLSSGTSGEETAFLDASENGNDAFFVTTSRLTRKDYDTGYDVYDAHVCTNTVPCATEPEPPIPCSSGDSCKPPPSPQPEIFGAPSSATFEGAGNVKPTRGRVVRRRSSTSAQKLARALNACRKQRGRRRAACERRVRHAYPATRTSRRGKTSGRKP